MQWKAPTIIKDRCLRCGAWTAKPYGLAVYRYTLSRAWRVAEAVEYGMISVNERITSSALAPFGRVKDVRRERRNGGLEADGGRCDQG